MQLSNAAKLIQGRKTLCSQKNIVLIDKGDMDEEHLDVKKLYLNTRGK